MIPSAKSLIMTAIYYGGASLCTTEEEKQSVYNIHNDAAPAPAGTTSELACFPRYGGYIITVSVLLCLYFGVGLSEKGSFLVTCVNMISANAAVPKSLTLSSKVVVIIKVDEQNAEATCRLCGNNRLIFLWDF